MRLQGDEDRQVGRQLQDARQPGDCLAQAAFAPRAAGLHHDPAAELRRGVRNQGHLLRAQPCRLRTFRRDRRAPDLGQRLQACLGHAPSELSRIQPLDEAGQVGKRTAQSPVAITGGGRIAERLLDLIAAAAAQGAGRAGQVHVRPPGCAGTPDSREWPRPGLRGRPPTPLPPRSSPCSRSRAGSPGLPARGCVRRRAAANCRPRPRP